MLLPGTNPNFFLLVFYLIGLLIVPFIPMIHSFLMNIFQERPKRCSPGETNICKTNHESQERFFHICGICPKHKTYPWTGKTGIENPQLNGYF